MDSNSWIPIGISLLIAIGGIVGARATAASSITDAAMKLIKPLNARIDKLEADVKKYKHGTEILIRQITKLGHKPDWTPEDDSETG
jgi:hypothetical protein